MPKPTIIFLVGFAGSGKTTAGGLLACKLGWTFIDLDREIERQSGLTVAEIFGARGERAFRQMETSTLRSVCARVSGPTVVALGGGTLLTAENRACVHRHGQSVYLRCSQPELLSRLRAVSDRPLLKSARTGELRRRISKLLGRRRPYYQRCDWTISTTNKSARQVAKVIYERLK